MRQAFWRFVRRRIPAGQILPWWALGIRAVLFPIDTFYWRLSSNIGYQVESDTWLIHGVRYSGASLHALADAQGEIFRISREGDTVTVERLRDDSGEAA
jgi:hypothetical protein